MYSNNTARVYECYIIVMNIFSQRAKILRLYIYSCSYKCNLYKENVHTGGIAKNCIIYILDNYTIYVEGRKNNKTKYNARASLFFISLFTVKGSWIISRCICPLLIGLVLSFLFCFCHESVIAYLPVEMLCFFLNNSSRSSSLILAKDRSFS